MKKYIIVGILAISTLALGEVVLPENVRRDISEYAQNQDERGGRVQLIASEKRNYFLMEEELAKSNLSERGKDIVRMRLKAMYGAGNYTKQNSAVGTQIDYVETQMAKQPGVNSKNQLVEKNNQAREEMQAVIKSNEARIPPKYMAHFKAEAVRLHPNDLYEQKRYIESSINTYKLFNEMK